MNKKIIHLGLPKTGTTFLQNIIYPKLCKKMNTIFKSSQKSIKLNGGSGKGFSSSSSRKTTGNNNTQVYMDAVSMIFIILYFSYDYVYNYVYNKHKPPNQLSWKEISREVDISAKKGSAIPKLKQRREYLLKLLRKMLAKGIADKYEVEIIMKEINEIRNIELYGKSKKKK